MKIMRQISFSIIIFLCFSTNAIGQIDSTRSKFIEALTLDLKTYYVSLKLAQEMGDSIRLKFSKRGYDSTLNPDEFAFEITQDLRAISNDQHIKINPIHFNYLEESLSQKEKSRFFKKGKAPLKVFNEEYEKRTKDDMFTYGDIAIFPGNIGYIEIEDFASTPFFKSNKKRISLASVLKNMQNVTSIIIDLRNNTGGLTRLAAKFCSYFVADTNTYFITTEDFFRYDSSGTLREYCFTKKYFTDSNISLGSMSQRNVFILIGKYTFSAAELVAYKIKRYKPNSLLIGEQTRGGGNGYFEIITNKFYSAIIPSSICFDEKNSNYNIEGKGIIPDINSNSDSAFNIAYRLANKDLASTGTTKYFNKRKTFADNLEFEKYFSDYIGIYRKIHINIDNGKLYMIYDSFKRCILSPINKDVFQCDDFSLVQFVRKNNIVIEVQVTNKDGYVEKFRKQ